MKKPSRTEHKKNEQGEGGEGEEREGRGGERGGEGGGEGGEREGREEKGRGERAEGRGEGGETYELFSTARLYQWGGRCEHGVDLIISLHSEQRGLIVCVDVLYLKLPI